MALPEYLQPGRVLYLAQDPQLVRAQLAGEDLSVIPPLRRNVTTDQIIPAQFTTSSVSADQLGDHLLRGFGGIDAIIEKDDIKRGGFKYLVAEDIGGGSSREHAQHALKQAGIEGVFASTWGKIFDANNNNYVIPTMKLQIPEVQDFLLNGQPLPIESYLKSLGPLRRLVAENDGILEFTRKRLAGEIEIPQYPQKTRPMNAHEKVYAKHLNLPSVEPGQQHLIRWDWVYFYELQSKDMGAALAYLEALELEVQNPNHIVAHEDHLGARFDDVSIAIRDIQRRMVDRFKIRDFRADPIKGVSAICHSKMAEEFVEPGQFVIGNDSHTNALESLGVVIDADGATGTAVSMFTGDTIITVPEEIKINLIGNLKKGVHAKDVTLHIGALDPFRNGRIGLGRKIYYTGEALETMPTDEHFVLANMSRELQAEGGFIFPNSQTLAWLEKMRPGVHFDPKDWEWFRPDPDAEYSHSIDIDLSQVEPTIALPGDPQNAVPLSKLAKQPEIADLVSSDGRIYVTKVYTGSCMGGTLEAIKNMANVFTGPNGEVRTVHPDIKFYFQAASENVYREAVQKGYIQTLEAAGAILVKTACGACIGVGEGSVDTDNEVALFDTNRNFEGREGRGKKTRVFLGNEEVCAATAITRYICSPEELT